MAFCAPVAVAPRRTPAHPWAARIVLVHRPPAELAARQQVSVERIAAAALAEQLSGWARVEQMAGRASRERFLAALDKVPPAEPMPEDRL